MNERKSHNIPQDCWERLKEAGIIKSRETWKEDIRSTHPGEVMRVAGIGATSAIKLYRAAGSKTTLKMMKKIYNNLDSRTDLKSVKAEEKKHFLKKKAVQKMTKERRYIALIIEPAKEFYELAEKIEKDNAIAYNGRIPHKILHLTIKPPENISLDDAKKDIEELEKLNLPSVFEIEEVHKFPASPKIMYKGKFNIDFDKIKIPHVTFAEFDDNKKATEYFEKNKEEFNKLKGLKLNISDIAIVKKNYGIEYKLSIKSKEPLITFDPKQVKEFVEMFSFENPIKYQVFRPTINGKPQLTNINGKMMSTSVRNVFCKDADEVVRLAKEDNGKGLVCIGINELKGGSDIRFVTHILVLAIDTDVKKERKVSFVSTEDDHEHAIYVALKKIKPYLENMGFKVAMIDDSGNGAHIYIKVKVKLPENLDKNKWLQTDVYKRLLTLENDLREKEDGTKRFEDDIINIDFITKDVVRRMKCPGTLNIKDTLQKENRLCEILYHAKDYDEDNNNKVLFSIKPSEEITAIAKDEGKELSNKEITKIIENDEKIKHLMNGEWQKYGFKSRSEAEVALISKLVFHNLPNKQIYEIMDHCKIGKWQEKDEGYKKISVQKARGFMKTRKVAVEESPDIKRLKEATKKLKKG